MSCKYLGALFLALLPSLGLAEDGIAQAKPSMTYTDPCALRTSIP